jgi:hypothetical protein
MMFTALFGSIAHLPFMQWLTIPWSILDNMLDSRDGSTSEKNERTRK